MSQEQPPIRSRRELRKARDERLQPENAGPGTSGAAEVGPASQQPSAAGLEVEGQRPMAERPAGASSLPVTTSGPAAAHDNVPVTGRNRRAAAVPVDSVRPATGGERSSQARARDRAALRTIKELAEKE